MQIALMTKKRIGLALGAATLSLPFWLGAGAVAQNFSEIPPNLTEATGPVKNEAQLIDENRAKRARLLKTTNNTKAGELTVEPPTLVNLGFHWDITGDANRNAKVEVTYRKVGEKEWHNALPLMRLQNEIVGNGAGQRAPDYGNPQPQSPFNFVAANQFAGSILNLQPGTAYEAHFVLSDPDGVSGAKEKTVTVSTRAEPMPAQGGKVYHVYPIGWKGPKQEPSFTGFFPAYYTSCHTSDFENAFPARVKPGDTILMHAGVYLGNRVPYTSSAIPPTANNLALCNLFDGTYFLTASGTKDKPIVIKAAGDGEVIFDGDGAQNLFNLMAGNYNYFEGITVRNTNVAFLVGIKNIGGSNGFTLKHSKIQNVGRAIQADYSGSKDFYIADNMFLGRHTPFKVMGWNGIWSKYPDYPEVLGGQRGSEYAVKVYGQGHVVAYNYIADWHDGIDVATYGDIDGSPDNRLEDRIPEDIDFYNNDLNNFGDNCIEADGSSRNIRIFNNRCFNSVGGALSIQPVQGGPVYWVGNIVYNTTTAGVLKWTNNSSGALTYQNTFVGPVTTGPVSNQHFRNNLIISDGGTGVTFGVSTYTAYSSSDYNGFSVNKGAKTQFEWAAPASGGDYEHNPVAKRFASLADYQKGTGQDAHSILVGYDTFMDVRQRDRQDIQHIYLPNDSDFRLKPNSAAIGKGMELPTITDGHQGSAPDLGALQHGLPIPHWGPRASDAYLAGDITPTGPRIWGWFYTGDLSPGYLQAHTDSQVKPVKQKQANSELGPGGE